MKCGAVLESIGEEQRVGEYIVLCPRDALIEKTIPDEIEEEEL